MSEKTKIELSLLLPQGNGCTPCQERLQQRLLAYRSVEVAHVELDGQSPQICLHYDPNLISLALLRAVATEEGAHVEWRYRHERLVIEGLDCADCARTLESGIERLQGILWVSVNFAASTLTVEYDAERVKRTTILDRIRALGYDVATPPRPEGRTMTGEPAGGSEMVFQVEGLDCADCALHLEEAVRRTSGVAQVQVDFGLARMRLVPATGDGHPDGSALQSTVEQLAQDMGYHLQSPLAGGDEGRAKDWRERIWRRRRDLTTLGSGLLISLGVVLKLLGAPEAAIAGAFIAAILVGAYYIARSGWAALRTAHSLDMNALMTIAALGSILVGEWTEGALAMFLFSLGNTLEGYTMERARSAIRGLMDLSPRQATVLHGNREERVPVDDLRVGDHILVRPGERIPMDGKVLTGETAVNQAPITGESVPVSKSPGDGVFAGTVNGQGALTVRVTRLAADTTLARIIKMVEEAQAQKAPTQRFVDQFARIYTPLVIAIAAGITILPPLIGWLTGAGEPGALLGEWFYRALVLLVIACPCALVISTPVSIVSAIASAARAGVLIKGGAHLESLGTLRVIAFDKTGTLTEGRPQVVDIRCLDHPDGLTWDECPACLQMLADAAAIERRSEHPLAQAVVDAATAQGLGTELAIAEGVEAVTGRGVRGRVAGHALTIGTHAYIHESYPDLAHGPFCDTVHAAQASGQTAMVIRDDCCGVRGYIAVADTLRPGVPDTIAGLHDVGIAHTVMLTGDNEATAQAVAAAAGVDAVQADLLPEHKVAAVQALLEDYEAVAMVGDGVNDAPALARATVGIAMGAAGTDTALETADLALMSDDLSKLPFAVELSRRTRAIIRQNVVLSLGIKALFLALALAGAATLWMAVFADVGASLIVILNGMRLLRR